MISGGCSGWREQEAQLAALSGALQQRDGELDMVNLIVPWTCFAYRPSAFHYPSRLLTALVLTFLSLRRCRTSAPEETGAVLVCP